MKKLIQITLALIMALSFVGCSKDSGKTDGPVEVTLWHTYTEHHNDFINQMIDEFNNSQTEVKVIAVQQPYQDYDANLLQAIRNGVGPDICSRFSTNVAADFGMKKAATADEFKSDFDVAANVAVSVLTVDGLSLIHI